MFGRALSLGARFAGMMSGGPIWLLATAPAQANTFIVTTTADGNNGACTVSLCTLRDAVIAANVHPGADVIMLQAGTYALTLTGPDEDNAATGDLDIRDELTINGVSETTFIDGNATDRVFEVVGAVTLTLNEVEVRNGSTSLSAIKHGGGIRAAAGTVVLNESSIFFNSAAEGFGGGISAANAIITNSAIVDNRAARGGGVYLTEGTSTITTSGIFANIVLTPSGGGAGIFADDQVLTVTDSIIWDNIVIVTGRGFGGGVAISGISVVTMTGTTIFENQVTGGGDGMGGGIENEWSLTITNCTVSGNILSRGGNFEGGGGIRNVGDSAVTNIASSTIAFNSATNNGGNLQNDTGGVMMLKNTIVSKAVSGGNCSGNITDAGTNLQFPGTTCGATIPSADPLLQPPANNGGMLTHLLGAGSPAIDAAGGCPPPATDQRGIPRPQGSACDIGSVECQTGGCTAVTVTTTPTPTDTRTNTPTPTNTALAPTVTPTSTPVTGVVVPTLSFPVLALLALALGGAALLLLRR